MSSSKQRRQQIILTRAQRKAKLERAELLAGLKNGTVIAVDKSKVFSRCAVPRIPDYYRDTWFTCKDCGEQDLWTAKQQKRWHEEQHGEIEAIAIRCRACRRKEKLQREAVRRIHLDGLAKKRRPEPSVATPAPEQL